jgi:F-type H+-transporting ATPase subunit delta
MASVTLTYARAFADVIFDRRLDAERALRDLKDMVGLLAENKDLREVWEAPSIPAEQKRSLLDAILARQGGLREVRNFLAVLIDHRRTQFLGAIVPELERELNQRLGLVEAEITSARELNPAEKRSLEAEIEKLTGKKVRPHYALDGSILGGAVVRVGSTIYDGSVKGSLERIREQLSSS